MNKNKSFANGDHLSDPVVQENIAALRKQYGSESELIAAVKGMFSEGAAQESLQFRAQGDIPQVGLPIELWGQALQVYSDAEELPAYWSPARDRFLRQTLHNNSLVSGIVYGEVTRVKNMPFTVVHEEDDQDKLSTVQEKLFQLADFGAGFPTFLSKLTLDYMTQDNGCFFEILGSGDIQEIDTTVPLLQQNGDITERPTRFYAKGERTGQPTGIAHLDAAQCWRTTNKEWPVIYTNPFTGSMTVMHWTRVFASAQFPQGYELGRGLGLCALSRSYQAMRHVKAINTYYYEKITGRAPEIFYVNTPVNKFNEAIQSGMFGQANKGLSTFSDPVVIGPKSGGVGATELKVNKFGLREAPDGFSYKEQVDIAVNILANAFGVDVREIWAATQTGATKADAEVQDMKTSGKGRADAMTMIEQAINWRVLPPEITFTFDEVDDLADKRKAEVREIRVRTRAAQIQSGELLPQEARQLAAESGDLDPSFLETVTIADESTDNDAIDPSGEPNSLPKETATEDDDTAKKKEQKTYRITRTLFFNNLVTFCELASFRAVSANNFVSSLKGELQLAIRAAFLDGIRDGAGNQSISEAELSDDEVTARNALIATQLSYTGNLRDFAYSDPAPSFLQIVERVSLWAAKAIDGTYYAAKALGAGNKPMAWKLGITKHDKHCPTCQAASGQVHRAKTWAKHGLIPRSDKLKCGGFNCRCELELTSDPIKGRIDRIPTTEK